MGNIFDKSLIVDAEFEWFKNRLSDDFFIPDDNKSKVIFGYNGIGKSTLYKCIKKTSNPELDYIEYDELKNSIRSNQKLVIATNINKISVLEQRIEANNSVMNISGTMKNIGIDTKKAASKFGQEIEKLKERNYTFNGFNNTIDKIEEIEKMISISKKAFFQCFLDIVKVENAEKELNDSKANTIFNILLQTNSIVADSDNICPVCGSEVSQLRKVIEEKIKEVDGKKSILVTRLLENDVTNINKELIDNLTLVTKKIINDKDLERDFFLCGGDSIIFSTMKNAYDDSVICRKELEQLVTEKEKMFKNVFSKKELLERDLHRYFNIDKEKISYDQNKCEIEIAFGRKLETFSTGELNLICFLHRMYSFIGSDKKTVLLDDPVSSLDMVNQYKIAFEIVKSTNSKKIIVLTHSIDFLNIINSQHKQLFDFYYLDLYNETLILNKINPSKENIISLDNLEDEEAFKGFLKCLKIKSTSNYNDDIHNLFHFTKAKFMSINPKTDFSNYDLIDLIDDFTSFKYDTFEKIAYKKLLYLSSLRIWIEKKLYSAIAPDDTNLKETFLKANSISEKIDCVLPRNSMQKVYVEIQYLREILISKKVMLNQAIHYYSQIMPLAYSLNLSIDDITKEINDLKSILL